MDDGVLQDRDLGGLRVGLDDHRVHAGGERRALGRVEVPALQAGLLVLGHRRLAGVADRELGRGLGRLVEGVAQRVGQHRDACRGRSTVPGEPLTETTPSTICRSAGSASSASAAILSAFSLARLRGEVDRRAAHHRGARGERADGVRHPPGVAGDHLDVLELHAELVGDQLREDGRVALALGGQAGRDLDLAGGLDVHVRALVGADAGALDVAGQADADRRPCGGHLGLERRELVPADQLLDLLQRRRVVAGVVLQLAAVLEDQPLVVGELVGLDEVDRAHLGAVLAEVRRDRVHRPLHRVAALRPAGAAVRRDHHGVGVERLEDDPVVLRLVGPEQLGRGDDRDDQAVRRCRRRGRARTPRRARAAGRRRRSRPRRGAPGRARGPRR